MCGAHGICILKTPAAGHRRTPTQSAGLVVILGVLEASGANLGKRDQKGAKKVRQVPASGGIIFDNLALSEKCLQSLSP